MATTAARTAAILAARRLRYAVISAALRWSRASFFRARFGLRSTSSPSLAPTMLKLPARCGVTNEKVEMIGQHALKCRGVERLVDESIRNSEPKEVVRGGLQECRCCGRAVGIPPEDLCRRFGPNDRKDRRRKCEQQV